MAIEVLDLPNGRKRVFLTGNTSSWPDPGDWNNNDNMIECVGIGGASGTAFGARGGHGAGGAGYAVARNVSLTFPVRVFVGSSGWRPTQFGGDGLIAPNEAICSAPPGITAGSNAVGGAPTADCFPNGHGGGAGGAATDGEAGGPGGGGGGAGGPHGVGGAGAASVDGGAGGAANGGVAFQWDETHGIGAGGDSGQVGFQTGGGAGGALQGGVQQSGHNGLIVITYSPLIAPKGIVKILRGESPGVRPYGREEGELYINLTDRAVGIIDQDGVARDIATPFVNSGGFVNRLRNGGFNIWQRGNQVSVPAGGIAYTVDGWISAGDGVLVSSRVGNGLRLSGHNNNFWIAQIIESFIAVPLAGKHCTFQCLLRNETDVDVTPVFSTNYMTTQDAPVTQVDEMEADLQTVPPWTTRRLAYTFEANENWRNGGVVYLEFADMPVADVIISECDLRATPSWPVGLCDHPPPPELRDDAIELTFCQRYYEPSGSELLLLTTTTHPTQNMISAPFKFKVSKRVVPTISITAMVTGEAGVVFDHNVGDTVAPTVWGTGENGFILFAIQPVVTQGVNQQFTWIASAEL